jgi:hypothetical protein
MPVQENGRRQQGLEPLQSVGGRRPLHFGIGYIEIKAEKIFNPSLFGLLQFFPLVVPQYLFMLCRKWYMNHGGS